MKINDRVKIWVAKNNNDWFEVQYYAEQIEVIIIWNKGLLLAQQIYTNKQGAQMRGKVFDISRNGIKQRIKQITYTLKYYDKTIEEFFDDEKKSNLDCFFDIIPI